MFTRVYIAKVKSSLARRRLNSGSIDAQGPTLRRYNFHSRDNSHHILQLVAVRDPQPGFDRLQSNLRGLHSRMVTCNARPRNSRMDRLDNGLNTSTKTNRGTHSTYGYRDTLFNNEER